MVTSTTNPAAVGSIANSINASRDRLVNAQETFMKLLTTQLRNQDPLSPLDSTQFTQQLTQMTGVEQQIYGNQLLENLVSQNGGSLTSAVGLIGRSVTAQGSVTSLSNGAANWAYNLPANAGDLNLEVLDSSGRSVWSGPAADRAVGSHTFNWNGRTSAGAAAPDGEYRLLVTGHNAAGEPITPTTFVSGIVSAVQTVNGATQLTVGRSLLALSSVVGVAQAAP